MEWQNQRIVVIDEYGSFKWMMWKKNRRQCLPAKIAEEEECRLTRHQHQWLEYSMPLRPHRLPTNDSANLNKKLFVFLKKISKNIYHLQSKSITGEEDIATISFKACSPTVSLSSLNIVLSRANVSDFCKVLPKK